MALTFPDFDKFFTQYHNKVYALCYLLIPDKNLAYDCTFRSFLRFAALKSTFSSTYDEQVYLLRAILSVCKAYYRKKPFRMPKRPQLAERLPCPLTDSLWRVFRLSLDRRAAVFAHCCLSLPKQEIKKAVRLPSFLLPDDHLAEKEALADAFSSLKLTEQQAETMLSDLYIRCEERSVGVENKIHEILEKLDAAILLLAALMILFGIFAVVFVTYLI